MEPGEGQTFISFVVYVWDLQLVGGGGYEGDVAGWLYSTSALAPFLYRGHKHRQLGQALRNSAMWAWHSIRVSPHR